MDILHKLRNKSINDFWHFFHSKILNTYLYKLHYLVLEINNETFISKQELTHTDVIELSFEDFYYGDPTIFTPKKMSVYKKRFSEKSYKAYGIFDKKMLVYSTWISFNNLGLPIASNYKLNSNEALLEDSYCHPSYRGKGLHSKMNLFRVNKIFEHGKSRALAIVLDGNMPAFKVQMKSGFKNLGSFYVGKILGIPFATLNKKIYDCK